MLIKTEALKLDGIHTDIVLGNFENKILVTITQTGKFGSVIRVDKDIFQASEEQENVYNIRTLFGKDSHDNHLLVRILAENITSHKPIIFIINLKSHSSRIIRALAQVLKEHKFTACTVIMLFGQLVIGPPGSGKSTYCLEMQKMMEEAGRKTFIVNLDPANESLPYNASIDINEFVRTEEVMHFKHLGPNGATLYAMEFLLECMETILEEMKEKGYEYYYLIDCPGQVELYTCSDSFKRIVQEFEKIDLRLCCVHLIDAHYCNDPGKFISTLLLALTTMLNLALPHVNVLSKIDLMKKFSDKLLFQPNYYTNVLNLSYLVDALDQNSFTAKYHKLNSVLASFIEDYSLVQFIPLQKSDKKCLVAVMKAVDKANGYLFRTDEERNIQKLLSAVMTNPQDEWDCEWAGEDF